jgi:hypothetical protein
LVTTVKASMATLPSMSRGTSTWPRVDRIGVEVDDGQALVQRAGARGRRRARLRGHGVVVTLEGAGHEGEHGDGEREQDEEDLLLSALHRSAVIGSLSRDRRYRWPAGIRS